MEIKEAIKKVTGLIDLTMEESRSVFDGIMSGSATPAQIGALLAGLRMKGETVDEITGAAEAMRSKAVRIKIAGVSGDGDGVLMDTCGTGGTGKNTFNISTTVAFILAAAGIKVAKHGNRAASGKCGSADVLEELGVKIDIPADSTRKCIEQINIGFLFAPLFHKAMKYAVAPRREMGIRTIFNLLGPLSNPADANCQVIGVYDADLTEKMAGVLGKLGIRRACVVHGENMFDEVTLSGKTRVSEVANGELSTFYLCPEDFGFRTRKDIVIEGGGREENAGIVRAVLSGREKGPALETVLMNASLAFYTAGEVSDYKEGVAKGLSVIRSGAAEKTLGDLINLTNKDAI